MTRDGSGAMKAKPMCFYLPQFHRVPENDRWWGEGFTEWTLVREAHPLFAGHAQPVVPHADIGYYDLTDTAVRQRQADLAREYGVYGFCYYHYWFAGTRLLHTPLELMLEDGQPDLPFCLCWANEPWSRRWSGEDQEVLQSQVYGGSDDWQAHFAELSRFFDHPNYIRVDGCPVFLVYRIGHVTDAAAMVACWRELARTRGYAGLHIVAVQGAFDDNRDVPPFVDAVAEHHPSFVLAQATPLVVKGVKVAPVEELWRLALARENGDAVRYRGACHAWDNTPRRGRDGYVILPSRPERFTRHLAELFDRACTSGNEPFVFLNAWNEWSEGAHLEPDNVEGYRWLQCVRDALDGRLSRPLAPSSLAMASVPSAGDWLDHRRLVEPDVDLINAFVMHGARGRGMIDLGCATGLTGRHLGLFAGTDYVVGVETGVERAGQARSRLDQVIVVDPDTFDWSAWGGFAADLLVCADLIGRLRDPRRVLEGMRTLLEPGASAWLGFVHAGHHGRVHDVLSAGDDTSDRDGGRAYTVAEAVRLAREAGYSVERIYRVYGPRPAGARRPRAQGNSVTLNGITISGLTGEQVDSLFCLRFFVVAHPETVPEMRHEDGDEPVSFTSRLAELDRTISPHDSLFNVYVTRGSAEQYFVSALEQVQLLDRLLSVHCGRSITTVDSIADYACHYGRLLRALRAFRPEADLYAYDIDPDAVAFCARRFGARSRVIGWDVGGAVSAERHDLLICASLITHTDCDFFIRVLGLWRRMLAPGGLLCFTYLGSAWIERWRCGELDHYGQVDPAERERRIEDFRRDGHVLAGFGTLYSASGEYGVGFIDEPIVRREVARYPDLEYLGTIGGDDNAFNQDLAVVRRRPR